MGVEAGAGSRLVAAIAAGACVLHLSAPGSGQGQRSGGGRAASASASVSQAVDHASIDWSAGLLEARGAAAADLRAPSPQVARDAATRLAEAQARTRLRAAALALVLAGGEDVATAGARDPAVLVRLDRALGRARSGPGQVTQTSDGSVALTLGLPLEAIRQSVVGPRLLDGGATDAAAPTAIVVDATAALTAPSLGLTLALDGERLAAPTTFHRARPAAAELGAHPLELTAATAPRDGVLAVTGADSSAAQLAAAASAGVRVIILLGPGGTAGNR